MHHPALAAYTEKPGQLRHGRRTLGVGGRLRAGVRGPERGGAILQGTWVASRRIGGNNNPAKTHPPLFLSIGMAILGAMAEPGLMQRFAKPPAP